MLKRSLSSEGRVHKALWVFCFYAVCELNDTEGNGSSVKILLSWYFGKMIGLIINDLCAPWPLV